MNARLYPVLLLMSLLLIAPSCLAQADSSQGMDEMMKLWKQVSTPGEEHARLNDLVGSWITTSTMWMDPDNPMVTTGTSEMKWILGGRFLHQQADGEMMGMPFHGIGITGYDIYNKKYVAFWIDNSSTAMFTMEGAFDRSGKVLTMYGKLDEWLTGERDKNVKYVFRMESKDRVVFEIYDLSIGDDAKVMQIEYARKK